MHIVLIGICGAGKTTVGKILSEQTGRKFADADDFHSEANKTKMRSGRPLTDEDRYPWLLSMHDFLARQDGEPVILACSALKQQYRRMLERGSEWATGKSKVKCLFVWLSASRDVAASRVGQRSGHYMPASLVDSQLNTLEPPNPATERCMVVAADRPLPEVVRAIADALVLPAGDLQQSCAVPPLAVPS